MLSFCLYIVSLCLLLFVCIFFPFLWLHYSFFSSQTLHSKAQVQLSQPLFPQRASFFFLSSPRVTNFWKVFGNVLMRIRVSYFMLGWIVSLFPFWLRRDWSILGTTHHYSFAYEGEEWRKQRENHKDKWEGLFESVKEERQSNMVKDVCVCLYSECCTFPTYPSVFCHRQTHTHTRTHTHTCIYTLLTGCVRSY